MAAVYATQHPTSGIVLVEGTFLVAPFAEMLRSMEPVLRGPGFGAAWSRISEYAFRLDEVPADVRSFVEATSRPRQDVVLGYWQDLFARTPAELQAWLDEGAARMRQIGLPVTSVVGQEPSADEAPGWRRTCPPLERSSGPAAVTFRISRTRVRSRSSWLRWVLPADSAVASISR